MQLQIAGQVCEFIPLPAFRAKWTLPDEFCVAYFEPKDWEVGQLDSSNQALGTIKKQLIRAVPEWADQSTLLQQPQFLAATFRDYLEQANHDIGLNEDQLDFAVDGLENILQAISYELIRLAQIYKNNTTQIVTHFNFQKLYQQLLNDSGQLFAKSYTYQHQTTQFEVKIISYLYGRLGMQVQVSGEIYYVLDMSLTCPAWGYMGALAEVMAKALSEAFLHRQATSGGSH